MTFADLRPAPGEHAFIAGKTGSGKTVLAYALVQPSARSVLVFDAKGRIRWPGFERARTFKDFHRKAERGPRVIYAPNADELRDRPTHEAFFRYAYERTNTLVYVDEGFSVTDGEELPDSYFAILTRGRELNVTAITSTQRPMNLPQEIMSESSRFYVFRLAMPQDRKKVASFVPVEASRFGQLQKQRFIYYRDSDDEANPPPATVPDGYRIAFPKELLKSL